MLHILQTGLQNLEQFAYEEGALDIRMTLPFLSGVHLAILIRKGYADLLETILRSLWEDMETHELLRRSILYVQTKRRMGQT